MGQVKRIFFPKTRLSELAARAGGMPRDIAIEGAMKSLEAMRGDSDREIAKSIAQLETLVLAPANKGKLDPDQLKGGKDGTGVIKVPLSHPKEDRNPDKNHFHDRLIYAESHIDNELPCEAVVRGADGNARLSRVRLSQFAKWAIEKSDWPDLPYELRELAEKARPPKGSRSRR